VIGAYTEECISAGAKMKKVRNSVMLWLERHRACSLSYWCSPIEFITDIDEICQSMRERHCFRPCFLRAVLFATIVHKRPDLVTILLSDRHCIRNSSLRCPTSSWCLLDIIKHELLQTFFRVSLLYSLLTSATVYRLHEVMHEEILTAVDDSCIVCQPDTLRLLVSFERDLNQNR